MSASTLFVLLFVAFFFSIPIVMVKTIKKISNLSENTEEKKIVVRNPVPLRVSGQLSKEQEEHIKRLVEKKLNSANKTATHAEPSLKEPDHDDSVFTGSLGSVNDEGFDPCHEEQLSDMEILCKPENTQGIANEEYQYTGFRLTANDIVNGFIVSEIINNKQI